MANLVFQSGSTWRKLGYAMYSNSLAYREVLNDNRQWTVMRNPPLGTILKTPTQGNLSPGLSQQSPVVTRSTSGEDAISYYPFDTKSEYMVALSKYSPSALFEIERLNGWSANSIISDTGEIG